MGESSKRDKRVRYTEEFKQDAVRLSGERGVVLTAKELGITSATLSKWRGVYSKNPSSKKVPSYSELLKENHEIKKELEILKDINEVLKKSTAIFCKDHLKKRRLS